VRSALISIVGQPRDAGKKAIASIAGKSLARRQLDFALAAGAEQVFFLGDGAKGEATDLCRAAETAGAKALAIGNGHELLGAVRAADHLLVLAPGVLPEAPVVLDMLGKGSVLLVLPAAQGVAAGFERVDLERAWAGALVVQGGLVERLAELPRDADPAPALLRIALQAKVAERRLPEPLLTDGSWLMLETSADASAAEQAWIQRHLPEPPRNRPARWVAALALRLMAHRALRQPRSTALLGVGGAILSAGAIAVAAAGWPAIGFLLVALAAVATEMSVAGNRLAAAPFPVEKRSRLVSALLRASVDLALLACAALAIDQDWLHRLFPPLVLLGLLHAFRPEAWPGFASLIADRMVLALVLAFAVVAGLAEPAVMVLALAAIIIKAVVFQARARITPA